MSKTTFKLKSKDREYLLNMIKTGKHNAREYIRAFILMGLDKGMKYERIEESYNVSRITIWRVKSKYSELGLEGALKDDPRPGQPIKHNDKNTAEIIALACSDAPEGRARWTLRLLEKEIKKRNGITINRESIRLLLKKTNVSLG